MFLLYFLSSGVDMRRGFVFVHNVVVFVFVGSGDVKIGP